MIQTFFNWMFRAFYGLSGSSVRQYNAKNRKHTSGGLPEKDNQYTWLSFPLFGSTCYPAISGASPPYPNWFG